MPGKQMWCLQKCFWLAIFKCLKGFLKLHCNQKYILIFQLGHLSNLWPWRGQSSHSCDHASHVIRCGQIVRAPVKYSENMSPNMGLINNISSSHAEGNLSNPLVRAYHPLLGVWRCDIEREASLYKVCWDSEEYPMFWLNWKYLVTLDLLGI